MGESGISWHPRSWYQYAGLQSRVKEPAGTWRIGYNPSPSVTGICRLSWLDGTSLWQSLIDGAMKWDGSAVGSEPCSPWAVSSGSNRRNASATANDLHQLAYKAKSCALRVYPGVRCSVPAAMEQYWKQAGGFTQCASVTSKKEKKWEKKSFCLLSPGANTSWTLSQNSVSTTNDCTPTLWPCYAIEMIQMKLGFFVENWRWRYRSWDRSVERNDLEWE